MNSGHGWDSKPVRTLISNSSCILYNTSLSKADQDPYARGSRGTDGRERMTKIWKRNIYSLVVGIYINIDIF